jgi:hypothetical protein
MRLTVLPAALSEAVWRWNICDVNANHRFTKTT